MRVRNTDENFGLVAIFFHWLMAFLIMGLLILGIWMTKLSSGPTKSQCITLHKEFGILVLLLFMLRIVWRLSNTLPSLNSLSVFERITSLAMQWLLYFFMFIMPMSGWLLSSTGGYAISFFGFFRLPSLIPPMPDFHYFLANFHEWAGYTLIAAIVLHIAAALKHHFIVKDDILKRISTLR